MLSGERLSAITARYDRLTVAVAGDYCLDRYFEIDPARQETSIETQLPAHQVVNVRSQPGGAGTVMNNVVALCPARAMAVGFAGLDGEGYELRAALEAAGVDLAHFFSTPERVTFTYGKPLVLRPGQPPEELSRLDRKNWTPTPPAAADRLADELARAVDAADAVILMEQVDHPETGALTASVKTRLAQLAASGQKVFLADSRCDIAGFANVIVKLNRDELRHHFGQAGGADDEAEVAQLARRRAQQTGRPVVVTLSADGILAAEPDGTLHRAAPIPVQPPLDIVGAGDCVSANLAMALAAGATLGEAIEIANLAASVVVKKLGTTGTATRAELAEALARLS